VRWGVFRELFQSFCCRVLPEAHLWVKKLDQDIATALNYFAHNFIKVIVHFAGPRPWPLGSQICCGVWKT